MSILSPGDAASISEVIERVFATCREMVLDRGYTVEASAPPSLLEDGAPALVAKKGESTLWVVFHSEEKIGVKTVRSLLDRMDAEEVDLSILVARGGATPFTKKELGEEARIEVFQYKELIINITRMEMCPPHTLLSAAEEAEVIAKLSREKKSVRPKLFASDPVCKYHAFKKDSIVRIRRSFGGESADYYRVVC